MTSDVDPSRRNILSSVAGMLTGFGGLSRAFEGGEDQYISGSTNRRNPQQMKPWQMTTTPAQPRPAYLALPGLNCGSLLANIPSLMKGEEQRPVIIMDIQDYNWLQSVASERNGNPLIINVAMAFGHLFRRGVIQFINYRDFYSAAIQQENIQRNQTLLKSITDTTQKEAAIAAIEAWKHHSRGEYLDTHRSHLGQDQQTNRETRRIEEKRVQKMERGLGAPLEWNRRILNKHVAALKIRQYADDRFDHLDIKSVIGEGEYGVIRTFVDAAPSSVDTSYITDLDPNNEYIEESVPEKYRETRKFFDSIGEIAAEREGVQHYDWALLSPSLVIPQNHNLFDLDAMEDNMEDGETVTPEQVDEIVTTLERRTGDSQESSIATEWYKDSDIMPFASVPEQWEINKTENFAANLAQYSRELRSLKDDVSPTAALIATSIVTSPSPHDDLDFIYAEGEQTIDQYAPQAFSENQIVASFRREDEFDMHSEWYEDSQQR
jgi:hypothetical protein